MKPCSHMRCKLLLCTESEPRTTIALASSAVISPDKFIHCESTVGVNMFASQICTQSRFAQNLAQGADDTVVLDDMHVKEFFALFRKGHTQKRLHRTKLCIKADTQARQIIPIRKGRGEDTVLRMSQLLIICFKNKKLRRG